MKFDLSGQRFYLDFPDRVGISRFSGRFLHTAENVAIRFEFL